MTDSISLQYTGNPIEKANCFEKVTKPIFYKKIKNLLFSLVSSTLFLLLNVQPLSSLYTLPLQKWDVNHWIGFGALLWTLITVVSLIMIIIKLKKADTKSRNTTTITTLTMELLDKSIKMSDDNGISFTFPYTSINKVEKLNDFAIVWFNREAKKKRLIPIPVFSDAFKNITRDEFIQLINDKIAEQQTQSPLVQSSVS